MTSPHSTPHPCYPPRPVFLVSRGLCRSRASPSPAILSGGEVRHAALRTADGGMAMLRARAGGYARDVMVESAGHDGTLQALTTLQIGRASCRERVCQYV